MNLTEAEIEVIENLVRRVIRSLAGKFTPEQRKKFAHFCDATAEIAQELAQEVVK